MIKTAIPFLTREQIEHRAYRPKLHQIHLDRKNNCYIIVTESHAVTETNKPIVLYRRIDGGSVYAVPLNTFNELLEDDKLRFVVVNNYTNVFKEENLLDKAIKILKEIQDEGSEDMDISKKIKNFFKLCNVE